MKKRNMLTNYSNIILHIPHSSDRLFGNDGWKTDNLPKLQEYSHYLVDWYTDELFVPYQQIDNIHPIIFNYNRILCDVERMLDDPLEEIGLGFRYECILSSLPEDDGQCEYARNLYIDHHAQLAKALNHSGIQLLLDCHSFSTYPTMLCSNPPQDIDICIGFNEDESKPDDTFISQVCNYFIKLGYHIGINTPYSNSKTLPVPHGINYHSLMIELNKSLYMDEHTGTRLPDKFSQLRHDLQQLYKYIYYA